MMMPPRVSHNSPTSPPPTPTPPSTQSSTRRHLTIFLDGRCVWRNWSVPIARKSWSWRTSSFHVAHSLTQVESTPRGPYPTEYHKGCDDRNPLSGRAKLAFLLSYRRIPCGYGRTETIRALPGLDFHPLAWSPELRYWRLGEKDWRDTGWM